MESVFENKEIKKLRMALSSLSIYRNLLEDKVISRLSLLLQLIDNDEIIDPYKIISAYNEVYFYIVASGNGTSLKDYIFNAIINDENPYSRCMEVNNSNNENFRLPVEHDLDSLQFIAYSSPEILLKKIIDSCFSLEHEVFLPSLDKLDEDENKADKVPGYIKDLKRVFSISKWKECYDELSVFYGKYGYGLFSKYMSFIWDHTGKECFLRPVENPDPITLSDLIDYETERSEVLENTLQLLKGYPANNILLYGDRGTGKSSTVKAIVNEFYDRGLRIIEVPKIHLLDFNEIVRGLRNRTHKFIIFVDDLVFEDNEENYTALKAALEGGIESKPQNVVIYATSNRRHLIKEKFSDRQGLLSGNHDDEVRASDSIQEKLSLADRFGITVVFSSPGKERYLKIVEGIAAKRGLNIDREILHKEAMKWELWYNGRSPRTARQFIDWMEGMSSNPT